MKELSLEIKSDLDYIKKFVNDISGVDICTKDSTISFVRARRLFIFIVDDEYDLRSKKQTDKKITLQQLAKYLGYKNHTPVLTLLNSRTIYLLQDKQLNLNYKYLKLKLANRNNLYNKINYLKSYKNNLLSEIKKYNILLVEVDIELKQKLNDFNTMILNENQEEEKKN